MKKSVKYILWAVVILGVCIFIGYQPLSMMGARNHLQNLSADGLDKITLWANRQETEIYDIESQQYIISCISRLEPVSIADMHAAGAISFYFTLYYQDGQQERITLPALTYPTLLGSQYYYCTLDGDETFHAFDSFFEK